MAGTVTMYSTFDPTKIQFSPVGKTSKGGKIVYLSFENNDRIKVQTPVMSAPFGVSSFDDSSSGMQSHSLDASFKGHDSDQRIGTFLSKCRALDDTVLETAIKKSREWFSKAMGKELVEEFMRKQVRDPADSKYAPTTRFKITPGTAFFDENQNEVDMTYITKGTTFRAIVALSSVWFVNKQFGTTWRLEQLGVVSRPDRLTGYALRVDEDGDDDTVEDIAAEEM